MEHYYTLSGLSLGLRIEELVPDEAEIAVIAKFFESNGINAKVVM
jgi:hypothetical protein